MEGRLDPKGLSISSQAFYRVQFKGVIDPAWADTLGEMRIVSQESGGEGGAPVTTLLGEVADQASLAGILNTLYRLRLPLISVTFLGETDPGDAPDN